MDEVLVIMPRDLTPDMLRAVRKNPLTSCEDKDEENRRIGWLMCAWDVLVESRTSGVMEALPAHLRDDAPNLKCDSCGRKSWDVAERGHFCNMPQPGGRVCSGILHPVGVKGDDRG
jgi:hypothetical protein